MHKPAARAQLQRHLSACTRVPVMWGVATMVPASVQGNTVQLGAPSVLSYSCQDSMPPLSPHCACVCVCGATRTGPWQVTTPARRHLRLSAVTCPSRDDLSFLRFAPGWREFVHQDRPHQAAHPHRGKYEAKSLAAVPQRLHFGELGDAHLRRQGDHLSGLYQRLQPPNH